LERRKEGNSQTRTVSDVRVGRLTLEYLAGSNDMGSEDVGGKIFLVTFLGLGLDKENLNKNFEEPYLEKYD